MAQLTKLCHMNQCYIETQRDTLMRYGITGLADILSATIAPENQR